MKESKLNEIKGHFIAVWEHNGNIFSEELYKDEDGLILYLIDGDRPDSGLPSDSIAHDWFIKNEDTIKFLVAGE